MKIIIAKNTWLSESDLRMDASYHLSDSNKIKYIFKSSPYRFSTIDKQAQNIYSGNIFKRTYVTDPERGIPYLTGSDMIKQDIDSGKFLSKKQAMGLQNLMIKKGWILVSCSGTLGNTVYTNELFEGRIATHDLIRIIPNNKDVMEGFLYAYLTSKYGNSLLTQSSYGGVVKHIEPHHIANIPVPIFPIEIQQQVHDLIIQSTNLNVLANNLLDDAERVFQIENELFYHPKLISKSENIEQVGFTVKYSNRLFQTIKARNYSERASSLINIWELAKGKPFYKWVTKDGLTRGMGGFFKRIDNENIKGVDIISQGDIHDIKPKYKQVINRVTKESEIARRGMIILPAAGTLGENEIFLKPTLVYLNFEGKILSEVVGKLRCETLEDAAYLYIALKSKVGFRILRSMVYGTNLLYPRWDLLKNINIPCKDEITFNKVSQLVKSAFEKRADAKQKEFHAIQLVEKEIESWQKS